MTAAPETRRVSRFACTSCGACCNRSPEVALSEAAALADVFVFQLMFRLYWLPRGLGDDPEPDAAAFYQKKRHLAAFAARKYPAKRWRDGKAVAGTKYLTISALALDTRPGACAALDGQHCGIYARRPLACRTAPFHYSRVEALAERDLQAFVETPGYRCETGAGAAIVLDEGLIVDPGMRDARAEALLLAGRERRWTDAIVRRMGAGRSAEDPLPGLVEIEANAPFGATAASMRIVWRIAAEIGLIGTEEYGTLIGAQLDVIGRALAAARSAPDTGEALLALRTEYRHYLSRRD